MHLSFKSVCNKEHKGVICYIISLSDSSQSTRPTRQVLCEELLVLSRFNSLLRADKGIFCPLLIQLSLDGPLYILRDYRL